MKTIIYLPLIIIVLILLAALSGCDSRPYGQPRPYTDNTASASSIKGDAGDRKLRVYRDPGTGCEYLSAMGTEGITPRMRADGTQVCE